MHKRKQQPNSRTTDIPAPKAAEDINEFCRSLSIGRSLVYQEIARGALRPIKIGRRTLITAAEKAAYIARLSVGD